MILAPLRLFTWIRGERVITTESCSPYELVTGNVILASDICFLRALGCATGACLERKGTNMIVTALKPQVVV
jgi:hypothetical protein